MKLEYGYQRRPGLSWSAILVALAITIPGASLAGQEGTLVYYDVKEVLKQIALEQNIDQQEALQFLYRKLAAFHEPNNLSFHSPNTGLVVKTDRPSHVAIRELLDRYRRPESRAVCATVHFIEGSHEVDVDDTQWHKTDQGDWAILSAEQAAAIIEYRSEAYQVKSAPMALIANDHRGTCEISELLELSSDQIADLSNNPNNEPLVTFKTGLSVKLHPVIDDQRSTIKIQCDLARKALFRVPSPNKYDNRYTQLESQTSGTGEVTEDQAFAIRMNLVNENSPEQGLCGLAIVSFRITDIQESEEDRQFVRHLELYRIRKGTAKASTVKVTRRFEDSEPLIEWKYRHPIVIAR
jgi:hypothetical protein